MSVLYILGGLPGVGKSSSGRALAWRAGAAYVRVETCTATSAPIPRSRHASPSATLEPEGELIWIKPYRPGQRDNLHPGMGIRFIGLTDAQRHRLVEFIKTFAYLADQDE